MPHLIHISPANNARAILKTGITPTRFWIDNTHDRGVWLFPVLPSFTLTHSWARELKRKGATTLAAVTVKLTDQEPCFARYFNHAPQAMSIGQAIGSIRDLDDPRGFEIIVPRRITAREIVRAREIDRAFGWRFYPQAKGRLPPTCDCPMCRDTIKGRRTRERITARLDQERAALATKPRPVFKSILD